ncbi:glycosyltransferase family 2 protein [Sphingomonas bacterium]|uniref:glycosyltransferase family 2 protein n=1 Tax=Sphingomonas bacterium TaxID=1895847 RepID=UPI0015768F3A|nr:glycosyltransferase family 2 protein [Sphingomonas bacterium]
MPRRIAVVIVNYRTAELALGALASLDAERTREPGLEVVIVDGGSGDGSADRLRAGLRAPRYAGWTSLLALEINGGFGWANNQAMLRLMQSGTPPDYIHLLNPDTRIEPGAVASLADALDAHRRCGAVGSLLLEPDGSPSGSAFAFITPRRELARGAKLGLADRLLRLPPYAIEQPASEVDWVTGASVMLRAEALREAGLFDTGFFLYFEEMELMARIRRAGWTIRHEPASRVVHVGGAATGINGSRPTSRRPPLPAYWYESRRRFFTLGGGRSLALASSLGWLAGHAALLARRLVGSGRDHPIVARDARRLLLHGLVPKRATPAFPRWNDPPGAPPAWMR